jgi:hypothetical protein
LYKKVISAAALLALSISSAAFAANTGGITNSTNVATLPATANIDASCAFSSNNGGQAAANNGFNFGDITTANTASVSTTASLTYVCNANNALTTGTAIGLALSDVNGGHGTTTYDLKNTSATSNNTIDFNIVQTSVPGVDFVNSNVNFQNVTTSPVISLTATTSSTLSNLAAGAYTDTITATLNS